MRRDPMAYPAHIETPPLTLRERLFAWVIGPVLGVGAIWLFLFLLFGAGQA